MAALIILLLVLVISPGLLNASAIPEVIVHPEELARLKKEGVSETVIDSAVERLLLVLSEKRIEAKLFEFVPKVIPSRDIGRQAWKIESKSKVLLSVANPGGYLSTKTRAEVIARQLNRALEWGAGEFFPVQYNGRNAVVFQNSENPLMIASASKEDAASYGDDSDSRLIAEQWADELNRFWQLLPQVLLHPLPDALTLPDLLLLSKIGLSNQTLLSFLHFRDIDVAVKAEHIRGLKFSKEVAQYLTRRLSYETDQRDTFRYFGSYGYCSTTNITTSISVSFGASGGFASAGQRSRSSSSRTKGSVQKGSHSGVRGRNFTRTISTGSTRSTSRSNP